MRNYRLLQAIEESKDETLKGFGARIEVSGSYVGMVINGHTKLSQANKIRWARLLGSTVAILWGSDE